MDERDEDEEQARKVLHVGPSEEIRIRLDKRNRLKVVVVKRPDRQSTIDNT